MDERQNPDPDEAQVADEYEEDDAASGAASLIGMRIRRRPRRGQGPTGQTRGAPAPRPPSPRQQPRRPLTPAAPPAAPQRPVQEPAAPSAAPRPPKAPLAQVNNPDTGSRPQDIVRYWDQLRNGRKYPTRGDLDPAQIIKNWPNSMLVRRSRETKGWQLETQFSGGIPGGSNGQPLNKGQNAECASMVTEWILSLGREVASLGKPLQDTEVFPTTGGEVRYNVIALPLSDNQNDIDHVLYHLVPATGDQ